MDMVGIKNILVLISLCCSSNMTGQTLTLQTHHFRHGDDVKRFCLHELPTLDKDDNGIWDLSNVEKTGKVMRQRYRKPSDTLAVIGAVEYGTRYYYPTGNDTLSLLAFENNLMRLDYDLPEVRMRFPVSKGDSIGGLFHATGTYCDKLRLRSFGSYSAMADDQGKLVCLNGDTLRRVLRLHMVRITAQQHFPMDVMPTGIGLFTTDSILYRLQADTVLLREDIWRWYAPGYRYPVLEVFAESYDTSQAGSRHAIWYCPPDEQQLLAMDAENLQDRQWQTIHAHNAPDGEGYEYGDGQKGGGILRYTVENDTAERTLHISYQADETARLRFILSDTMGIVYQSVSRVDDVGSVDINYASLRRGQYVVYIHCNEQVFAEKFNTE